METSEEEKPKKKPKEKKPKEEKPKEVKPEEIKPAETKPAEKVPKKAESTTEESSEEETTESTETKEVEGKKKVGMVVEETESTEIETLKEKQSQAETEFSASMTFSMETTELTEGAVEETFTIVEAGDEISTETMEEIKKKKKKLGMDVEETESTEIERRRKLALEEDSMKAKQTQFETEFSASMTLTMDTSEMTEGAVEETFRIVEEGDDISTEITEEIKKKKKKKLGMDVEETESTEIERRRKLALEEDSMKEKQSQIETEISESRTMKLSMETSETTEKTVEETVEDLAPKVRAPAPKEEEESSTEESSTAMESSTFDDGKMPWNKDAEPEKPKEVQEEPKKAIEEDIKPEEKVAPKEPTIPSEEDIKPKEKTAPKELAKPVDEEDIKPEEMKTPKEPKKPTDEVRPVQEEEIQPDEQVTPKEPEKPKEKPEEEKPKPKKVQVAEESSEVSESTETTESISAVKKETTEVKQVEESVLQIVEEGETVTVKREPEAKKPTKPEPSSVKVESEEESSSAFEGDESFSEESERERQKRLRKKKRITTEVEEMTRLKGKRRVEFEEEDLEGDKKREVEFTEKESVVKAMKGDEVDTKKKEIWVDEDSESDSDVSEKEKKKRKKKKITTEVEETMKTKGKRKVEFEEEDLEGAKKGTELTIEQEELTLKGQKKMEMVTEHKEELMVEETTTIREVVTSRPVIEVVPMPTNVMEGQTIRLNIKVKGEGQSEVKWYKDDKKLKNKKKPNLRIDYDSTEEVYFLEITNATVEDTGSYTVKASNAGGSVTSTVSVVVETTIKAALPSFADTPKPVKVTKGESILLTSKIEGTPEPEVTWTKNGEPVRATANDSRISIEMDVAEQLFTLEISDAKEGDSGNYSIIASNSEGTVTKVVEVTVLSGVEEEVIEEEKVAEAASAPAGVAPEIAEKPKNITVSETETITVSITIKGTPTPTVSWLKNKSSMIVKEKIEMYNEVDIYYLIIKDAATNDSGEYTVVAENSFGSTSANFTINVQAVSEEDDSSIMDRIADQVAVEKEKVTDKDKEELFKEYPLLGDHSDKSHGVDLVKDDVVQVMDTAKEEEWLCRKKDEPGKVCYVPVELLLGKPKPKDEEDAGDEGKHAEEVYPLYVCIADYEPVEEDHLAVVEGQTVEVLDSSNPDLWLCRTLPDELGDRKQGWIPPSYLVNKKDAKAMSTREAFREDIIKVDNKQQEIQMKRRYALNDLWESERDYIQDLKFCLDTYYVMFDGELPDELVGKKEYVFANYKDIHTFHEKKFLDSLCECTQKPNSVGQVFLDHADSFQMYVDYYLEREVVDKMLQDEALAKFIKEYDENIKNVGESKHSLREYLARPFKRIDEYVMILQDFLRYSAQVGDDTEVLQKAIQMLMDLRRKAEQKLCTENITGYPGDLAALGPILRHEDFLVWEGEVTGKGKERHLFLYKERLLITKKKKSKIPGGRPTFEFITEIQVPEVWLHEFLPDERRFALSYQDKTRNTYTFQAKTVPIKVAWCNELRRLGFAPALEAEAPEFIGKLKDVLATEGETVRLECQISGKPFPELKWFHEGDLINPSSDLRIENDNDRYFLVMPRASPAYSGTFTVKATNKHGTQECSAELIVEPEAKEPKVVNKLRDTEVRIGEDARFECKITAHPAPDVKWYKGDDKITESDKFKIIVEDIRYILIIKNITEEDVGKYKIKVKNKLGSESSKAKLSLTEEPKKPGVKPTISDRFTDVELIKGEKAEFVCKLKGEPVPEVTWYHNKNALVETERIKILQTEDTYTLIITKVLTIDTGEIKLVATNEEGEASCSAKLFVTDDTILKKETGKSKDNTKKSDEVDSKKPDEVDSKKPNEVDSKKPDEVDYKEPDIGQVISKDDVKDDEPKGRLNGVDDVTEGTTDDSVGETPSGEGDKDRNKDGDKGKAKVTHIPKGDNIVGNKEEKDKKGEETKPKVDKLDNGEVEGRPSLLDSTDKPSEDLGKDDKDKKKPSDTKEKPQATTNDSGISDIQDEPFTKGKEKVGDIYAEPTSNKASAIGVQEAKPADTAPSFTKKLNDKEVPLGNALEFKIKYFGAPEPTVTWYFGDKEIIANEKYSFEKRTTSYKLRIESCTKEDYGKYSVTLKNELGEVSCSAQLREMVVEMPKKEDDAGYEPPIMPMDKPFITDIGDNYFSLNWLPAIFPSGAKRCKIRYVIERRDLPSSDWNRMHDWIPDTTFMIENFDPSRDYMYRVRAETDYGESDPTNALPMYAKTFKRRRRSMSRETTRTPSMEPKKERLPPKAPRDKPLIFDVTDDSLSLSWQPAEIPSYAEQTGITYIVERRCPPKKEWIEIATDVKDCRFFMPNYKPDKDYMFRIRAANKYGTSDPSTSESILAKPIEEPKVKKEIEEHKPKVKPRTIWDKPELHDITDTSVTLKWKPSSCPNYAAQIPIWYIVEQREPPDPTWVKLTTNLEVPELTVTKGFSRKKDFYWRVRAVNEVGQSEPSMPAMLRRIDEWELELKEPKKKKREKSVDDKASTRAVPAHLRIIPEFLSPIDDTQYGVETLTAKVVTRIRGYPEPKIMWYFRGEKLMLGDKHRISLSSMGELTLEVTHFTWKDVGEYKLYIENEFGNALVNFNIEMADPPTFLEPMHDKVFNLRRDGKLECRVIGIPYPKVTFKHDWRVIADSHRIKIAREDFDHWTVNFRNAIYQDEGMYECVAENLAGKVYCVANVKITEKIGLGRDVKFNRVPVEEYFHLIDEIGRGSCGIVRRVIDKNSGNQYAVKLLNYGDELTKDELVIELEMMSLLDHHNLVQIIDGYENKKCLAIVMEIVTGGELIPRLLKEDSFTESEAAYYIRQLLLGLEYMHAQSVMHLDVKPENIFLSTPISDQVKLLDFGNARRYIPTRNTKSKYGSPEFVAPEVANECPVTPATDMWSVGVITYLLLSGVSPFHCPTPKETLEKVKKGDWSFDEETFANASEEAKDFIKRLMATDPKKRMTASEAIEHKFIALSYHRGLGDRIALDRLRGYAFRRKAERGINCVKGNVQLRPLSTYLDTKAAPGGLGGTEIEISVPVLNLPGDLGPLSCTGSTGSQLELGAAGMLQVMGPPSTVSEMGSVAGSGGSSEWGREYEDEDTWYEFSSSYQAGADTQLIPSIDTALTARLAQYRRSTGTKGATPRQRPGRRERREVRDMERIEEDAGADLAAAVAPTRNKRKVWQLKSLADAMGMEQGFPPIFKEKIRDKAYSVGESCTITVRVQGNPPPTVSWYRNEELLTDGGRVRTNKSYEDSKYSLTILSTKPNDFGVFKCVARNKYGKVTCRGRMLLGDIPGRPGRPHVTKVSDTEAFMVWEEPEQDGNSTITAYRVDWLKPGDERWTTATYCIDECALIKGLRSDTSYRFRVTAINKFGLSPFSFGSVEVRTKKKGASTIDIDSETKKILLRSRQATNKPSPDPSPSSSRRGSWDEEYELGELTEKKKRDYYGYLDREIHLQEIDPAKFLTFGSEVWRGRFTLIRNVKPIKGKTKQVAKIIPYDARKPEESLGEYEMLKNVRQEHIIRMFEAYHYNDFVILVFEKMYGENVARTLSLKNRYNEHQVVTIIKQVLDAVQFLHHRGIVHLNIQPDNVLMVSRRRLDIKLTDFGRARRISSYDGEKVPREGTYEFMAPEKVNNDKVGVPADIWGVGLLAFILLSGVSPFRGETDEDTMQNIKQVRYDAHQIYHNVTKYALKFIYLTLRKSTLSRLTTEECLEHKWLMLNAPMIKQKKAAIFSSDRLHAFEEDYIRRRVGGFRQNDKLIKTYGAADGGYSSDEEDIFPKNDY